MRAEIVSIGTEILLGEITDTNASYLAGQLPLLGIDLYWISQVGDNKARLKEVLQRAWQRSELILTTGGLGPTEDDVTRETIAEMLGEKLEIDPALEKEIRAFFAQWGMEMPLSNLRQATVIPSARPIGNARGTAPGWWVERDNHILAAMPGPPLELQEMWQVSVLPRLQQKATAIIVSRTLKTLGLSEAAVGEAVSSLMALANPTLGVYAKADGIQLRLTAKADTQEQAQKLIAEGETSVRKILGEHIWGTDDDTLESVTGHLLVERGWKLAVMEDYTGGWLTSAITDFPESRTFFEGGLIACSDKAKIALGVDAGTISRHGAVSPEVAEAMAQAAKKLLKADIGISVTGMEITADRPTGIVYIGVTDSTGSRAVSRPRGRRWITTGALFELRKSLLSITK